MAKRFFFRGREQLGTMLYFLKDWAQRGDMFPLNICWATWGTTWHSLGTTWRSVYLEARIQLGKALHSL
jgi:hypothetical protein